MLPTFAENKEKLFAYLSINDFFDTYILQDALCLLHTILKAAGTSKIWNKGYPFTVLHYMQQLGNLCEATFYIHDNNAQREEAIIAKEKQMDNPAVDLLQTCIGGKLGDNFWSCFPRNITLTGFYDPYLVLKKFCQYMPQQQWKKAFADIQEYALTGSPISDSYPTWNLLSLRRHMACLIEACHLLDVRTNLPKKKKALESSAK